MKRLFLVLALAGMLSGAAYAAELDPLLRPDAGLWNMSGEMILRNVPDTFRWMDRTRSRLRFNAKTSRAQLSLFGRNVQEVIFDFREGRVSGLSVSVYNRGDAGTMEKKSFDELLDELRASLQSCAGKECRPQSQNATVDGSRLRSQVWKTAWSDIVLRWSLSSREPEYAAVDFYPPGTAPRIKDGLKTTVGSSELEAKVQTDPDGSHYLLIPMVDQGAKGYCVAATVERVLRYYGSNIDQHVIAKLAESDAEKGTSIGKIIDVLESSQSKLGIRFERLYRYDFDVRKMIKEYNSIARRMDAKKIDLDDYVFVVDRSRYFDFKSLMESLDFKILRDIRMRDNRDYRDFLETVREKIDSGVPLCWSTFIIPGAGDTGSSEFGLHMRIITGYNDKTGEIIFSDSWGVGHEKKKLKNEDAWSITTNLIALEPRRK